MRLRMLWPLVIVLGVLAALDAFFWYEAAHASGIHRTGLVSSASALLVAVVGVGGTAVGAYLTAEYARGTARTADRRAAYARFLGAAAAYRQGRERADTIKTEQDKAYEHLDGLKRRRAADDSSVEKKEFDTSVSLAADWADRNRSAAAALLPLSSDLQVSAAATRLLSPPGVRSRIDALVDALLKGQNSDNELASALDALSTDT
jgi:hypothetical protein